MPLADYQTMVTDLVRDDASRISDTQRDDAIASAVSRYSADRPRDKVEDVAGVEGNLMALPAGWQADFSELETLEYPIGKFPPQLLPDDRWDMYLAPGGLEVMLLDSLAAASTVRATYTIRHQLDSMTDTIPVEDREPVAKYAAAILCDQLAAFYANETDSTIGADSVRQTPKSQAYKASAKDYRKFYQDKIGVMDKTAAPAGAVATLRSNDSLGQPRLFHPVQGERPL